MDYTIAHNYKTGIRYTYNEKTHYITMHTPNEFAPGKWIKTQTVKVNNITEAYAVVRRWNLLGNQ